MSGRVAPSTSRLTAAEDSAPEEEEEGEVAGRGAAAVEVVEEDSAAGSGAAAVSVKEVEEVRAVGRCCPAVLLGTVVGCASTLAAEPGLARAALSEAGSRSPFGARLRRRLGRVEVDGGCLSPAVTATASCRRGTVAPSRSMKAVKVRSPMRNWRVHAGSRKKLGATLVRMRTRSEGESVPSTHGR